MAQTLSHDLIYEAILDEAAFACLPGMVAEAVGARSALFQWRHHNGDAQVLAHSGYFRDEHMAAYIAGYTGHDLWMLAGLNSGRKNQMIGFERLVTDDTFAKSIMYNEFIRSMGDDTFRCMGAIFDTPFGVGALGIHRGRSQDDFEAETIAGFNRFTADLRRMLAIRGELMAARTDKRATRSSFDSLDLAILQIDGDGRLLETNALADELLRDHGALTVSRGYLRASAKDGGALKKAIATATGREAPEATLLALADVDGQSLSVTISPLLVPGTKPRAMILIKPPIGNQRAVDKALMQLYGLSPAEAQVSISLAEGLSPADIAVRRQVSEGTVRIQLKTIMAKIGCRRQTQISAAVLSLPPLRLS